MKLHRAQTRASLLQRLRGHTRDVADSESALATNEYRLQVQLLRSHNHRLKGALTELLESSEAAAKEHRRTHRELQSRLDQSRSAFEVAWSGFGADSALDDQLTSLDLDDDRARRWLLTP